MRFFARLFLRVLVILTMFVYLGTTSLMPVALAHSVATGSSSMPQTGADRGSPMPCNGPSQGCCVELGCAFLIGVAVPNSPLLTTFAWSSVTYDRAAGILEGRTFAPALGPPISLA
jgi:hypothetical protein